MLKGLLEKQTCAECQICCGFDSSDLWEMPVMTEKTVKRLSELNPSAKFLEKDGGFVTDPGDLKPEELFFCPALDREKGCVLGEDKPFDCRIWPLRVMETEDKRYRFITVSPVCPEIFSRSLAEISRFVQGKLENEIFRYAQENPQIIKPYIKGYPIIAVSKA